MSTLAIIPCTGQKSDEASGPAEEIWIGSHFQLVLAHVEMFYDEVLVLSYKYGLISPKKVIESYDIDMRIAKARDKIRWWFMVKQQIDGLARGETPPALVALYTGHFERDRIIREFVKEGVNQVIVPFEGKGIGQRQQAVYDCEPPFDEIKIKNGEYAVKLTADGMAASSKYLPPPTKLTDDIEWED
jgi:hypothetical protein